MNRWFSTLLIAATSGCVGYFLRSEGTVPQQEAGNALQLPRVGKLRGDPARTSFQMMETLDPEFARATRVHLDKVFLEEVFSHLAQRSPEKAAEFLSHQVGLENYSELGMALVQGWSASDPVAAYRWLMEREGMLAPTDFESARACALTELAVEDPVGVAGQLSALKDETTQEQVALALAKTWGTKDSKAALAWLARAASGNHLPEDLTTRCYHQVMDGFISNSPQEASRFVTALESSSLKSVFIPLVAKELARRDFGAAAGWVQSLPDDKARQAGLLGLSEQGDSARTSELLSFFAVNSRLLESDSLFTARSMELLVKQDRAVVQERLHELPAAAQGSAAHEIAHSLLKSGNAARLEDWLTSLPPGQAFVGGVAVLAHYHLSKSPDLAFQWLGRIGDSAGREHAMSEILAKTAAQDLRAVQEALGRSRFSSAQKSRFQNEILNRLAEEIPTLVLPD